ncbi:general transcription factor II-I isoform X2 [Channa argus]|uniref:general transcription factor II-I isoform X2 n=1 Tax=Channa argus TaxID=215402 RepID=UPI0035225649
MWRRETEKKTLDSTEQQPCKTEIKEENQEHLMEENPEPDLIDQDYKIEMKEENPDPDYIDPSISGIQEENQDPDPRSSDPAGPSDHQLHRSSEDDSCLNFALSWELCARTVITEEQREILKSFFQEGMASVGSPLIPAAAEATGLAPVVIENWIGNHRRSLKSPTDPRPLKPKLHTRNLSAYNLFCRDLLRNKGRLKDIKPKWSSLGEEQRNIYYEEAAALKAEGKTQHLSPEMRALKVKKHLKQLKLEVSSLEALGVETAVISFDRHKTNLEVHEICSKGASAFLESMDIANSFALHFKAFSPPVSSTKEPVDVLVKRVQEVFNQKYKEAGGVGRLPYQSLLNQSVTIHAAGLPNGLTLKKPSFYGRKQLEEILKAAEQISFQIDSGVETQPVEEMLEAMCENGNGRHKDLLPKM